VRDRSESWRASELAGVMAGDGELKSDEGVLGAAACSCSCSASCSTIGWSCASTSKLCLRPSCVRVSGLGPSGLRARTMQPLGEVIRRLPASSSGAPRG
jgi:hypothetical protein